MYSKKIVSKFECYNKTLDNIQSKTFSTNSNDYL